DVGFDLYVRLVGEAVAEFRGDDQDQAPEVRVELPVDAHVPHDYVASERLRLEAYRRLSEVSSDEEVAAVADELRDRYGPPPPVVENLLSVARFRVRARQAGLREVTVQGRHVRFGPMTLGDAQRARLNRLYPKSLVKDKVETVLVPRPSTAPVAGQPLRDLELLNWARQVIDDVLDPAPVATGA
ncbi:MAG TPA: TRCF domain-containing protein, partial [Jiangellaceae bacterium]|nr:TRCF domain-containing protein [Jiangellaceae bacterium]